MPVDFPIDTAIAFLQELSARIADWGSIDRESGGPAYLRFRPPSRTFGALCGVQWAVCGDLVAMAPAQRAVLIRAPIREHI